MFHSNTERLIDYWRSRKGAAPAPARASIDPCEVPSLMPQLFILGRNGPGGYAFRLVGGLVEDLHGAKLSGTDPVTLWAEPYRPSLRLALEAICRQPEPLVVTAEGRAGGGQTLGVEITFAPLTGPGGDIDRFLGLYQPKTMVAALRRQPIKLMSMRAAATPRAADGESPRLMLASINGRQIA
jgi:hypothetical protein